MGLNWVKVYDRLLPRSRAWGLTFDRTLRQYFEGLSGFLEDIKVHSESILRDAFPDSTSRYADWSYQFGSPETLTNDQLVGEWGAFGGQSPQYIQDTLRNAGFDVYVHEWWVPGTNPPEARNPIDLIETSRLLVNDLAQVEKYYTFQCGDGSQCVNDESIQVGEFNGYYLAPKQYPAYDNEEEYPYYYYVCGQSWPGYAVIYRSQLRKLIRLIYKTKPVHLRCILRVVVVDDPPPGEADILDTTYSLDFLYDSTSAPDDLNDKT